MTADSLRLGAAALLLLAYALLCAGIALRERRRLHHALGDAARLAPARSGVPAVLVGYASQTGHAEELAWETGRLLHQAGEPVQVLPLQQIDGDRLAATERALFIVSTTGEGDAPDPAAAFVRRTLATTPDLSRLQYGLLALGDRQYAQYCAFGRQLDAWLAQHGATPLFERVEVDNADAAALGHWQHRLGMVASLSELPARQAPQTERWTLAARRQLNPGSAGQPVFHLELAPPAGHAMAWEAGDLVQVAVPADPEHPREYSIGSLPADGRIHLLVRQQRDDHGKLGLASGWLTEQAALEAGITLRLRPHRNFRLEGNQERPLILVGNGTGLAGLRSHLKSRAASGTGPNWLVFGERNAAHDRLYQDELQAWRQAGVLQRLDQVFSRDQPQRRYVQDVLAEAAEPLREWIDRGAAVYVCGSLAGMAAGVDAALRQVLGEAQVDRLLESGRYRRDVY